MNRSITYFRSYTRIHIQHLHILYKLEDGITTRIVVQPISLAKWKLALVRILNKKRINIY
jgi:hypothetical protein